MNPLFVAARRFQQLCDEQRWAFCFIGGLAVLRWGEPRLTRAVDVTIVTGFGGEDPVIASALASFTSRIEDAAEFARQNRVLLLSDEDGVAIDVALGALPFEERDGDWADVAGVITRQGATLNVELIWSELLPLLQVKNDHVAEQRLRGLLDAVAR